MRASNQVILREIAGEIILVPVGEMLNTFHGIMALNGSGRLLWDLLQEDCTEAQLVDAVLAAYETDRETAAKDVREFLGQLEQVGILVK